MASRAPSLLRVAGPLARAAADAAMRRLDRAAPWAAGDGRHPLAPAAVRVERARSNRGGEHAEQTAVTVWFGQGPALPVPGTGEAMRSAVRIGTGLLGAAALAAMTAVAARREEERRVIDAATPAIPISRRGTS